MLWFQQSKLIIHILSILFTWRLHFSQPYNGSLASDGDISLCIELLSPYNRTSPVIDARWRPSFTGQSQPQLQWRLNLDNTVDTAVAMALRRVNIKF